MFLPLSLGVLNFNTSNLGCVLPLTDSSSGIRSSCLPPGRRVYNSWYINGQQCLWVEEIQTTVAKYWQGIHFPGGVELGQLHCGPYSPSFCAEDICLHVGAPGLFLNLGKMSKNWPGNFVPGMGYSEALHRCPIRCQLPFLLWEWVNHSSNWAQMTGQSIRGVRRQTGNRLTVRLWVSAFEEAPVGPLKSESSLSSWPLEVFRTKTMQPLEKSGFLLWTSRYNQGDSEAQIACSHFHRCWTSLLTCCLYEPPWQPWIDSRDGCEGLPGSSFVRTDF